jgi:predicted glycosyltransferase
VDAVISDNRYGLYHADLYSVFITHQLRIRTPFGSWADSLLQKLQYRLLNRFSICWIPDLPGKDSLAGELSHPRQLPSTPVRYIGTLSRFEKQQTGEENACDLLILLSGPEPQRTIFEKMIMGQMPAHPAKTILVRGLPGQGTDRPGIAAAPGLTVYDHLSAGTLNKVVCGAKLILCRPGYSSVMDLIKLGKDCIFVPTPGQTEQEYLGNYLAGHHLAICVSQQEFSLPAMLKKAKDFPFEKPGLEMEGDGPLRTTLGEWLGSLKAAAY